MHHHLNRDDRISLGTLLRSGMSQSQVATQLGVHRSTISRELKRNRMCSGKYHANNAHNQSTERRRQSKQGYRLIEHDAQLQGQIESLLNPLVSPEVVGHILRIHHQTIYSWINRSRSDLLPLLPQRGRKRRRYGSKRAKKQGWTQNVRSIHDMNQSQVVWEGDTVVGRASKTRILTHVEQSSLYLRADVIPSGTADCVQTVLQKKPLHGDILYDRGSEFALWRMIEKNTKGLVYFCDAHAPWQRGKNENTNGRLRRVFPKGYDFSTLKQSQLQNVVDLMNNTPRKSLNWRTPQQVYSEIVASQIRI